METGRQFKVVAVICAALIGTCPASYGKVIYVDDNGTGPGDNSSWQTAHRFLQDARADAQSLAEPVEIRVARGVCKPDQSSAHPDGTRDRVASSRLLDDGTIKGGVVGVYDGTPQASMSPEVGPTAGLWSEPLPLAEVNLEAVEEWSPVLSADGLTLYFGRVRGPDSYFGRIFQATRQLPVSYSRFTSIVELPGTLSQSAEHVLCPWISRDGLRLYYTYQLGSAFGLMVSERPVDSILWPIGMEINELNQLDGRLHTGRLTADELTIFFAGPDQQDAGAEYDIWMAIRTDYHVPFDEPVNAAWLNSPANDQHATPSVDGLSLYFASKRSGRYQLFRSTRASCRASFGPPVHMTLFDTPNGHSMFPYLSPDGTEFYFVRQTSEDRSTRDIWVSYRLD